MYPGTGYGVFCTFYGLFQLFQNHHPDVDDSYALGVFCTEHILDTPLGTGPL
jgi:hypothetical protein